MVFEVEKVIELFWSVGGGVRKATKTEKSAGARRRTADSNSARRAQLIDMSEGGSTNRGCAFLHEPREKVRTDLGISLGRRGGALRPPVPWLPISYICNATYRATHIGHGFHSACRPVPVRALARVCLCGWWLGVGWLPVKLPMQIRHSTNATMGEAAGLGHVGQWWAWQLNTCAEGRYNWCCCLGKAHPRRA